MGPVVVPSPCYLSDHLAREFLGDQTQARSPVLPRDGLINGRLRACSKLKNIQEVMEVFLREEEERADYQ